MRKLVSRWIWAVSLMDDEMCRQAVDEIKAARADRPGPHWHPLELEAYERCVVNGCLATPDIRASVLHAQLDATMKKQLAEEEPTNGKSNFT